MGHSILALALACLIAAIPSEAAAQHAPPAQPFQRLDGCIYKPQRWNDGDSFHVILPNVKETIFRLYFVDTPEEERVYADRIAEQAAYFSITPNKAIEAGHAASEFTKRALAKPFTIQTRWRLARGRSKLPRYYAVVTTAEGRDLAALLVSAGLARIYGNADAVARWRGFAHVFGAPGRLGSASESREARSVALSE